MSAAARAWRRLPTADDESPTASNDFGAPPRATAVDEMRRPGVLLDVSSEAAHKYAYAARGLLDSRGAARRRLLAIAKMIDCRAADFSPPNDLERCFEYNAFSMRVMRGLIRRYRSHGRRMIGRIAAPRFR